MYKIYINESPLILCHLDDLDVYRNSERNQLISKYTKKQKFIVNHINMMENSMEFDDVIIFSDDYKRLKEDCLNLFNIVVAAGGLVVNEESEILFIFRRGHWDLPKGKMDPGEKKKETALREVAEETGLRHLSIDSKIGVTNHMYKSKAKKRFLKKVHWYFMNTIKQETTPQIEEGIVKAEWMNLEDFYSTDRAVFTSIVDILDQYQLHLSTKTNF